ncbi:ISKra4 family transposase ISDesp4 [subsurface metagenome]
MTKTINKLESKRKSLYKKLEEIGDFRRGTISVNYRKCGKKNCICAKPEHPGHGPQYLWNTTIKGKSYAKNLKLGPELKKYMEEIANYRSFLRLCEEIVQLNEKICDLRPIPEIEDKNEEEELKKKLQMLFRKK